MKKIYLLGSTVLLLAAIGIGIACKKNEIPTKQNKESALRMESDQESGDKLIENFKNGFYPKILSSDLLGENASQKFPSVSSYTKEAIVQLLQTENCDGILIYFGQNEDGSIKLVLIPMDANGNIIIPKDKDYLATVKSMVYKYQNDFMGKVKNSSLKDYTLFHAYAYKKSDLEHVLNQSGSTGISVHFAEDAQKSISLVIVGIKVSNMSNEDTSSGMVQEAAMIDDGAPCPPACPSNPL